MKLKREALAKLYLEANYEVGTGTVGAQIGIFGVLTLVAIGILEPPARIELATC